MGSAPYSLIHMLNVTYNYEIVAGDSERLTSHEDTTTSMQGERDREHSPSH
jgi:hypothetical protein